ncbi:unnamed protein product, partial [Owenia fusiformis]
MDANVQINPEVEMSKVGLDAQEPTGTQNQQPVEQIQRFTSKYVGSTQNTIQRHTGCQYVVFPQNTIQGHTGSKHVVSLQNTIQGHTGSQHVVFPQNTIQGHTGSKHVVSLQNTIQGPTGSQHVVSFQNTIQGHTGSQHVVFPQNTIQGHTGSKHVVSLQNTIQGHTGSQHVVFPQSTIQGHTGSQHVVFPQNTVQGPTVSQYVVSPQNTIQGPTCSQNVVSPQNTIQGPTGSQYVVSPQNTMNECTGSQYVMSPKNTIQEPTGSQNVVSPQNTIGHTRPQSEYGLLVQYDGHIENSKTIQNKTNRYGLYDVHAASNAIATESTHENAENNVKVEPIYDTYQDFNDMRTTDCIIKQEPNNEQGHFECNIETVKIEPMESDEDKDIVSDVIIAPDSHITVKNEENVSNTVFAVEPGCSNMDSIKDSTKEVLKLQKTKDDEQGDLPYYQCETCGIRFINSILLQKHEVKHKDMYPVKCETCFKMFKSFNNLTRHKGTNAGEKQFKCKVCEKIFEHKCALRIHKKTHTEPKPNKRKQNIINGVKVGPIDDTYQNFNDKHTTDDCIQNVKQELDSEQKCFESNIETVKVEPMDPNEDKDIVSDVIIAPDSHIAIKTEETVSNTVFAAEKECSYMDSMKISTQE